MNIVIFLAIFSYVTPLNFRPSHMSLYCVLTFDPKWQPISQNYSISRKIDTGS